MPKSRSDVPSKVDLDKLARSWRYEVHKRDRVRFARSVGAAMRRRITPDPWQTKVLASYHKRKLLCCGRQVGKSTVIGILTLHSALFVDESLSLLVAPTERQAKITFAKIARLYAAAGYNVTGKNTSYQETKGLLKKMSLELENGSEIVALPGNPDGVRGYSPDRVILEEAAFMPDELYHALTPSLAATDGELMAISSPNGRVGWFYEAWESGRGWERYHVPSTECPRITPEFLANEQANMPLRKYEQEYLAEFVDTEDAAFSTDDVDRAFRGEGWKPFLVA